ncbi:MAG TPA: hypothetical protein VK548_01620 [Candidatus Acidoferrum sp.]|nr:hypothetical protein [Candidatus Acidoferrum sp.]
MTLVKTDRPRRIDRVINYFGDPRYDVANDLPANEAVAIRRERLEEAGAV